ncbi:hypothetical protein C8R44DRAFT_744780 [Mycena epipterygia]|nr:hypothetical protein C8R44DRAFT_744780 [Mycena epipterygia]
MCTVAPRYDKQKPADLTGARRMGECWSDPEAAGMAKYCLRSGYNPQKSRIRAKFKIIRNGGTNLDRGSRYKDLNDVPAKVSKHVVARKKLNLNRQKEKYTSTRIVVGRFAHTAHHLEWRIVRMGWWENGQWVWASCGEVEIKGNIDGDPGPNLYGWGLPGAKKRRKVEI